MSEDEISSIDLLNEVPQAQPLSSDSHSRLSEDRGASVPEEEMAPGGSTALGNTRPVPLPPSRRPSARAAQRKRCHASKQWTFTLNNYSEEDIEKIKEKFGSDGSKKWMFAQETGASGTPHLQGFVCFAKKRRPIEWVGIDAIHWEKMKGTVAQNIKYCTKEPGAKIHKSQGLRIPRPIEVIRELRGWQSAIENIVLKTPDDRTVYWFWESQGGIGKSALVRYLCVKHNAMICAGSAKDMKYMIVQEVENNGAAPDIVLFDIPRSKLGFLSYTGLEEIKNGCFASTKYESGMCITPHPHVICFANAPPEDGKLSNDRMYVREINSWIINNFR